MSRSDSSNEPSPLLAIRACVCGLLLWLGGAAASPPAPQEPASFAIVGVTVVDPSATTESAARRGGQTVLVVGDRIERVGPAEDVSIPAGTPVLDGTGRFVIPGLWDMHVHPDDPEIWELLDPPAHLRDLFMPNFIAWGVTGVRDMGGRWDVIRDWRDRIDAGSLVGPRIVAAGPLVDGPDPSWPGSVPVDSPERGELVVDSLIETGVDFIKIYDGLSVEAFHAIVSRGHERGVRVAGHVPVGVTLDGALDTGLDDQQHLLKMQTAFSDWPAIVAHVRAIADTVPRERLGLEAARLASAGYRSELARQYYRRLARSGAAVTPTLVVLKRNAYYAESDSSVAPWLRYVPAYLRRWWTPEVNVHLRDRTPEATESLRIYHWMGRRIVGELFAEGVPLMAGSDTGGNPHLIPGLSLHEELELLVESGLSPLDALRSATMTAARYLGRAAELGTIEPGKVGDLVLLEADPLLDIANTRAIAAVAYRGILLDSAARGSLLDSIARVAGS